MGPGGPVPASREGFVMIAIAGILDKLGGLLLMFIMLLTMADVVGGIFNHPVYGVEEIVGLMTAVLLAFALPGTQIKHGHVGVDVIYRLLSPKSQKTLDRVLNLLCALTFVLIAEQCAVYGLELRQCGEVSSTVAFPVEYLLYAMALACLMVALIMFSELIKGGPLVAIKGH